MNFGILNLLTRHSLAALLAPLAVGLCAFAAENEELKVKRQEIFEFTQKPVIVRHGDRVEISFASKSFCDATVAIENAAGKIVRHLASGVLGANAPAPLQKDSLAQTLIWDGKDDQDRYIDDKDSITVRVSLGLRPQFERVLFWEPKKRYSEETPLMVAAPEGVYVYDGGGALDFLKLFDHNGNYVRTLYPFPATQIERIDGLFWHKAAEFNWPIKPNFLQNTMLTSGSNAFEYLTYKNEKYDSVIGTGEAHFGMYGKAATAMAIAYGRVALAEKSLNRFATDGSSGGMALYGPRVARPTKSEGFDSRGQTILIPPRSAAFSPDGKTLYLTGYNFCHYGHASNDIVTSGKWDCFHCVLKMDTAGDQEPQLFAGEIAAGKDGADNRHFRVPSSVATDRQGRVYVADYMNDRVQIFAAAGKFIQSVNTHRPAKVVITEQQELYVFSWLIHNGFMVKSPEEIKPSLTRFAPLDKPKQLAAWPLPAEFGAGKTTFLYSGSGVPVDGAIDTAVNPPTVWLAAEWPRENVMTRGKIKYSNIRLFALKDNRLEERGDFYKTVSASVQRIRPAAYGRQRLYVNPKSGKLYAAEGDSFDQKAFKQLVELDPETGAVRLVDLPFDAEDMCFDHLGQAYLRTISVVARYDADTWREIPWDYGEERAAVCTSSGSDRKTASVLSGLIIPANAIWHHGGMSVSLKGHLAIGCQIHTHAAERAEEKQIVQTLAWTPRLYPGRLLSGRVGAFIHVWDERGKLMQEDAVPGLGDIYGVGIDRDDDLYCMSGATRIFNGERYYNDLSGTLLKFSHNNVKPRIVSDSKDVPNPLERNEFPRRAPDLGSALQGRAWIEGADWFFGGVGYDGKNRGVGCACWNARFALDYFNRSFAPEVDRYSVAVLDSNGNLILRVGRYGNADSAGPKSLVPLGGDEVGLMHGAYVATHTDNRLFIADPANARIVSVKLDYHATERVALKDIVDQK
ncbi:MAG TPA: hypothetical protein VKX17_20450 [Planctomycetota bacterium]|nr:hypothetical protein [Planctomycetota bacterium]